MCALRSSTMIFTESRNMLKPVRSSSKTNIEDNTKRNMLLRAKKLSLDSESFMKSLQGKYEQKEPKPPPVVGLGVRRYKGTKSYLGSGRDVPIEVEEPSDKDAPTNGRTAEVQRKKSLTNGHIESILQKIKEEEPIVESNDIENSPSEFNGHEDEAQAELDLKLNETDAEIADIFLSFAEEDLDLTAPVREPDSGTARHHDAASSGDIAALKRLLRDGCDANDRCEDDCTPLQLACNNGHTMAVRILAKNGGDVDVVDRLGRSLLHTAVLGGHNNMVAALLEAGSKGTTRDHRRGRTPLHVATLENELVMIKMLVQALKDDPWGSMPLLAITDKDGRTPLHVAAGKGSVEAVKLLLSVGFSVTKKDMYGNTPMHAALSLNHANKRCRLMLRMLLEAGGDLAIKEEHPLDGEDFQLGKRSREEGFQDSQTVVSDETDDANPAGEAASDPLSKTDTSNSDGTKIGRAKEDSKSFAAAIAKGGSVIGRRKSSGGWVDEVVEHVERMIHMAARVGCGGCLALLIEYGAPVNSRDRRERTPLHLTAESNRPNAARTLARLGAIIDAPDCRGQTPLHAAIGANCGPMVEVLLDLGASHTIRDPIGRSYAEHALFARKMDSFRSLVKCGVSGVAEDGSTILHCSATAGCLDSTEMLLDMGWDSNCSDSKGLTPLHATIGQGHEDIATLLITEGANIMQRDNKGATPLHYAVRWGGSDALLRMLVKRGASVAAKDRLGRTPLHYAASKFSIMSDMYIILGGGASLNPVDISGLTPLHLAARLGNESLVRILLDKGANPMMKDMYNFTPYHHAEENKHFSIMKRLQDYMEVFAKNNKAVSCTSDTPSSLNSGPAKGGLGIGLSKGFANNSVSSNGYAISGLTNGLSNGNSGTSSNGMKNDATSTLCNGFNHNDLSNGLSNGSSNNPGDHSQCNGRVAHSSRDTRVTEVNQRSRQVGFQSRGQRTSVAW